MRTRAALRALPGLIVALSASSIAPAHASQKVLSQAKSELQRGRLVDVLTLLRPDEGQVGKGESAEAARTLGEAARKAVALGRPELALQLAEASFELDAAQPQVLALLGDWALNDGRLAQARRYAEIWSGVAPKDPAAQAFHEKVRSAKAPQAQGSFGSSVRALFGGAPSGGVVTLYTTSWCPACTRAKAWLKLRRVQFVEKDVEKEPEARGELAAEAQKQGVGQRGVPVLNAYGKLAEGFSEQTYTKLLKLEE